jgi:hypothetical protein
LRPLHRCEHWLSLGVSRPSHRICAGMNGHQRRRLRRRPAWRSVPGADMGVFRVWRSAW